MDLKEIRQMRYKQLIVTNVLIVLAIIGFFGTINLVSVTYSQFFIIVGVTMALQGAVGLIRGDTTKSIIPIFEKVAVYEKRKMGDEWYKERKRNYIWNIVLSGFMFMQAYWNRNVPELVFQMEPSFLMFLLIFTLLLINITSIIRFRKIDPPS